MKGMCRWILGVGAMWVFGVHAMPYCSAEIWYNGQSKASFYAGRVDSEHLFGVYHPRHLQRRFRENDTCLSKERLYVVTNGTTFESQQVYSNTNQRIFLQFPRDFQKQSVLKKLWPF